MTPAPSDLPSGSEPQKRFEQLEILRKASWESIASRRSVEWRVSISLWSILAGFIALVISVNPDLENCEKALLLIVPVAAVVIYAQWLCDMFKAYRIDKLEEGELRREMGKMAGYEQNKRVQNSVAEMIEDRWNESGISHPISNTMHAPQVMTTILFAILAALVVLRVPLSPRQQTPPPPSASSPPTITK